MILQITDIDDNKQQVTPNRQRRKHNGKHN